MELGIEDVHRILLELYFARRENDRLRAVIEQQVGRIAELEGGDDADPGRS